MDVLPLPDAAIKRTYNKYLIGDTLALYVDEYTFFFIAVVRVTRITPTVEGD